MGVSACPGQPPAYILPWLSVSVLEVFVEMDSQDVDQLVVVHQLYLLSAGFTGAKCVPHATVPVLPDGLPEREVERGLNRSGETSAFLTCHLALVRVQAAPLATGVTGQPPQCTPW